jgi:hypothetical protein
MNFEFRHVYPVPVEELERVLFHEDSAALMQERMSTIIEIEPIRVERTNDRLERNVRYLPVPMIKSVGPKKVEPEWMEWMEESVYDYSSHRGQFKNVPARRTIADLLLNHGTLEITPGPGGGCTQTVRGELKVKVFMIGKIAERIIHSNAVKILEEQARVLERIIVEKLL